MFIAGSLPVFLEQVCLELSEHVPADDVEAARGTWCRAEEAGHFPLLSRGWGRGGRFSAGLPGERQAYPHSAEVGCRSSMSTPSRLWGR